MNPDDYKKAWQMHSSTARLTTDAERLLNEVQSKHRSFTSTIFWRDVREVGVALVMVPVWIVMGINMSLPWTWYLAIPGLLWIAGFMLVDRMLQKRLKSGASDSLREHVKGSLADVNHQIWLLRNVVWWYLLPIALPMLLFFGQIAWNGGPAGFFAIATAAALEFVAFGWIYRINQAAVKSQLEPKRQELEAVLAGLEENVEPR
jgi:hypothetical protein